MRDNDHLSLFWKRIVALLILFFCVAVFLFFRHQKRSKRFEETRYLLGTVVQLVLVLNQGDSQRAAILFEKAYREIDRLDRVFSRYRNDSELSQINNSTEKTHHISDDLSVVIDTALAVYKDSEGAFDITMFPYTELWHRAEKNDRLPSSQERERVSRFVGANKLRFSEKDKTLWIPHGMILDLGGIAKGYIIQSIRNIWKKNGVENALINIGGDLWAMGVNEKDLPWKMGIQNPYDRGKIIKIVALKNQGLFTSGDYQRYFTIRGKNYSHIINPVTGYPVKGMKSVSVWGGGHFDDGCLGHSFLRLGRSESERSFSKIFG